MEEAREIGELETQGGGESPLFVFEQATFVFGGRTYSTRLRQWQRSAPAAAPDDDDPTPPVHRPASSSSPPLGHATAAAPGSSLTSNKHGRVPASTKAILGLREVTTPMDSSDCCAIRLQDLDSHHARPDPAAETPALRFRAMPCSHTFHQRCIFEWLRRNAVCPLCRHQLPTEEEEDDEEQEQDQGRRSRSRVVYNEEDGQNYIHWHYREQPVAGEEQELDDEQERRRTATLREGLARWRNTNSVLSLCRGAVRTGAASGTGAALRSGVKGPAWRSSAEGRERSGAAGQRIAGRHGHR
ncbi:hypothetical protein C2845_PM18G04940 [Panicum miliaceum]|uniref:RING-type domain-containing protein n=1 Tax=Panicum miliaceum TaxID=4540 RepID=A0A3L6PII9_PANMI|nr:hypothetical protein C2845_PM18G04940 [Panicum miliaceum]